MQVAAGYDPDIRAKKDFVGRLSFFFVFVPMAVFKPHMLFIFVIIAPIFGAQFVASGYKHAAEGAKVWSRVFIWSGYLIAAIAPIFLIFYFADPNVPLPFK